MLVCSWAPGAYLCSNGHAVLTVYRPDPFLPVGWYVDDGTPYHQGFLWFEAALRHARCLLSPQKGAPL